MKFVQTEELKEGMRLAYPVYNHQGVLLFEQDSKLTRQSINSITNFKLLGVYVLEPAEPAPPLTMEDIEFERFQAEYVYRLKGEMEAIVSTEKTGKVQNIVAVLQKTYGHKSGKMQFMQSLRSKEDYIYKHSMNVAILTTLMAYRMKLKIDECELSIMSALVHDIGKVMGSEAEGEERDEFGKMQYEFYREKAGHEFLDKVFASKPSIRRICSHALLLKQGLLEGKEIPKKVTMGGKILMVADYYDTMTAMRLDKEPQSEISTVKQMIERPDIFDEQVMQALLASIHIVYAGISVELNTGAKALVIHENPTDILRPTVLLFKDNSIMDLSLRDNSDVTIVDIVKTINEHYVLKDTQL